MDQDKKYFLERAEAQLELAKQSGHPDAVAAHYQLAELYLDRVYGDAAEEEAVEEGTENDPARRRRELTERKMGAAEAAPTGRLKRIPRSR